MKKKIFILLIAMTLTLSIGGEAVVPTASAATLARPSDELILERIAELERIYVGTYFNVGKNTACGKKTSGHGSKCSACSTSAIVKTDWFEELHGEGVTTAQFGSSGNSCCGFGWYAGWFLTRSNDTDYVKRKVISSHSTRSSAKFGIESNALVGDYLWLTGRVGNHAVIYITHDKQGVTVIDCNGSGQYNCLVQKRVIPWSSINTASICRFYSTSGNYCYHNRGYKTVLEDDGEYTAVCKNCNMKYPLGQLDTSTAGIYQATGKSLTVHTAPYQDSRTGCLYSRSGKLTVTVVGSYKNAYGSLFHKLSDGSFAFSGHLKKIK